MSSAAQLSPTHDYAVLVIDDSLPFCKMLVEVLTLEGYSAAMALIAFSHTTDAVEAALRTLQQADRPIIILADPTTFGIPGTEPLTAFLQDQAQRQPHLFYLMTALTEADAARAMTWLNADGLIRMPFNMDQVLALLGDGECLLRDRAATPPDPFTIDS